MKITETVRALSDHQILEAAEVMLSDDHSPAEQTEFYVAAYNEAMSRPQVKQVLDLTHSKKES